MTNTTIAISKKFHEWLKSKGEKGDRYEKIITKLLKPDMAEEYEKYEFKAIEKKAEAESKSIENKEEPKADSNSQQASSQNEPESKKDKPETDIIDALFEGKMD